MQFRLCGEGQERPISGARRVRCAHKPPLCRRTYESPASRRSLNSWNQPTITVYGSDVAVEKFVLSSPTRPYVVVTMRRASCFRERVKLSLLRSGKPRERPSGRPSQSDRSACGYKRTGRRGGPCICSPRKRRDRQQRSLHGRAQRSTVRVAWNKAKFGIFESPTAAFPPPRTKRSRVARVRDSGTCTRPILIWKYF